MPTPVDPHDAIWLHNLWTHIRNRPALGTRVLGRDLILCQIQRDGTLTPWPPTSIATTKERSDA